MTIEKMEQREKEAENLRRCWYSFDWETELEAYAELRSVKVGMGGPSYGGNIGGNYYDLTTKRNKKVVKQHQEMSDELYW